MLCAGGISALDSFLASRGSGVSCSSSELLSEVLSTLLLPPAMTLDRSDMLRDIVLSFVRAIDIDGTIFRDQAML